MTENLETCQYGKKYPCCNCDTPCVEELKRREFYDLNVGEPDEEMDDDPETDDDYYDEWGDVF